MASAPEELPPRSDPKALALLAAAGLLAAAFVAYVFYARGAFEHTQSLVLVADDGAGITVGMDLTFSGFPVGRVQRIELAADGKARIAVDVPRKDAKWLRAASVFTLERSLVGGARLRAFTGDLGGPPLPEGAVRPILRGDATEELPALVASMKKLLENLERLTAEDSHLDGTLAAVREVTGRMKGPQGALGGLLGGEENAKKVITALDRANALLASLDKVALRLDRTLGNADEKLFAPGGIADEARRGVVQLNEALAQARASLRRADAILADAQKVSGSAVDATADLAGLRAEVDASLRRVSALLEDLNRRWPFSRQTEITLP